MAEHANISDPFLHEPKGITGAAAGEIYVADGAGGGEWVSLTDGNHNTIAYGDKTIISGGATQDVIVVAANDLTFRDYADYVTITDRFGASVPKGMTFDVDGNFVIETAGVYQFNYWMSESNDLSKQEIAVSFYRNQPDANNLTGPVEGPIMRDKTKDLGGGEPSVDTMSISGLIELFAGDVIGMAMVSEGPGTVSISDGSLSLILLEDLS